jgi:photosystem II stability/assembly factor-like uncharacterized protein
MKGESGAPRRAFILNFGPNFLIHPTIATNMKRLPRIFSTAVQPSAVAAFLLVLIILSGLRPDVHAQRRAVQQEHTFSVPDSMYSALRWRCIGPFRGGRSATVCGVPGQAGLYYFGSTGGGVWKTEDSGKSWSNISDGYFGGSIGSVAISPSDPNILYVGEGEKTVRGNVSSGNGMWKTMDGGKSWKKSGLGASRHIPRIRIHPANPDIVYAAVLGDLYRPTPERGVYRSTDGGLNWERVLFANEDAGAIDLAIDPFNPGVLYASTWNVRRTPYSLSSGGAGSGLWKSTDGGNTWNDLSKKSGLPQGTLGIIGISPSPVQRGLLWAMVEAEEGGVFRSDDGGETWRKTNDSRELRQRAWYYSRIVADTRDKNTVYVLNVDYHKSTDGGRTFSAFSAPHGDHHDLWIAPEDSRRMIIADDGGAQVSLDGGESWSTYYNQPTAQFYRVTTDRHFPFRIYGAQQDNSTVRIAHRSRGRYITEEDWEETAGGESAHLAVDPLNDDIVYGGSYGGFLMRYDHRSGHARAINVWPDNPMGHGAEGMRYRFQWNFPIFFSPHNPKRLYACSNHLHVTENEGQSWKRISPDLTRNDLSKLGPSGGPITKDNTSVEYYCTIFAAAESPHEEGVIWTGSDDGLLHLSRDGGDTWKNVTPAGMPEWIMINSVEPDPHRPGGLYVAATMYKWGDYKPYLFKTEDYGSTWKSIVRGIAETDFTRVVRADPERKGLLYCGTERGMYVSFDDGASWSGFQLNLPTVPVTDLAVRDGMLIAATQGRSFWVLDDLTVLHQQPAPLNGTPAHLYRPANAYRMRGSAGKTGLDAGENHPGGVTVYFHLSQPPEADTVTLEFMDSQGSCLRSFGSRTAGSDSLGMTRGNNRFVWNLRTPDAETVEGMILWASGLEGPMVPPGEYKVRLKSGKFVQEQVFQVLKDPTVPFTETDLRLQFEFQRSVIDKLTETHRAILEIRRTREQLGFWMDRTPETQTDSLRHRLKKIGETLDSIEQNLYQTKNRSQQDPLNFPIRLNNKLAHLKTLNAFGEAPPTDQEIEVRDVLVSEIDAELHRWETLKTTEIPALNRQILEIRLPAVDPEIR